MPSPVEKSILEKIRYHDEMCDEYERLSEEHAKIAQVWEDMLEKVRALEKQGAGLSSAEKSSNHNANGNGLNTARADLVRELLQKHAKDGIAPVSIREIASEHGFELTSNYPYKLLSSLMKQGKAFRDGNGKYHGKTAS